MLDQRDETARCQQGSPGGGQEEERRKKMKEKIFHEFFIPTPPKKTKKRIVGGWCCSSRKQTHTHKHTDVQLCFSNSCITALGGAGHAESSGAVASKC